MAHGKKKALTEAETRNLERMIPDLAAGATHAAYVNALASGRTVVRVDGINIVATSASGEKRFVGTAKPRHKVKPGQVFKLGSAQMHAGT